jgi:transposase InsO family protein
MKFAFIEAEKACFPVARMCKVLEVSRSGFYAWRDRPPAERTLEDQRLVVEIAAVHKASRRTYGSPRVLRELRERGRRIGRNRIARLMRTHGIRARSKRRFRTTTDSRHDLPVAPNVVARRFEASAPDQTWVTDITYIWTAEGWLYLAVILDLFSRRVVGWSINERMTRQLTLAALDMALSRRRPPRGLVHHSDRGSQFASSEYRQRLAEHGILCSMSRRGNCWDNAVAESFFSTLKIELVYESAWATRREAKTDVFEYLEVFYNGDRRHSSIDYLSPIAFERRHEKRLAA